MYQTEDTAIISRVDVSALDLLFKLNYLIVLY